MSGASEWIEYRWRQTVPNCATVPQTETRSVAELRLVSSVTFPFIRIRFRNRFRKTVSALPSRNAVVVMPLPFRTFGAE